MRSKYYVAMHILRDLIPSSTAFNGNLTDCRKCVKRLMGVKDKSEFVTWHIYKCVSTEDTPAWQRLVE